MKQELDDLLSQRYPLTFAERNLSMQESCMYRGFSCDDGWFALIDALCERLQFWSDNNRAPQVVAVQVKEKFGGLRFYRRGADTEQRGMIIMAQAMLLRICEQCGKPGELKIHKHCVMTRCAAHMPPGAVSWGVEVKQG